MGTDISRGMYYYTVAMFAAAVLVTLAALETQVDVQWVPVAVLAVLTVVIEYFAFQLPAAGSVSLSFSLVYAALLYSGPLAGLLCAVAGAVNIHEFRARKPPILMVFNAAQLAVSVGLAGLSYIALGGQVLSNSGSALGPSLAPAAAAALVCYILNVVLVAGAASILRRTTLFAALRDLGFLSYGSSLVVLALLGLLLAYILVVESWLGMVLLVLPFMATRRVFRVYVELSSAYSETVRSLMAAIEAKDPYTRGHSERVAVYARGLAAAVGLTHSDVELVERAALLHDVGKIGISLDTLTSHEKLTAEEVRAIRVHPLLGGEIVAEIEFLKDAVPVIRYHHERYDGAGYPDGVVGDGIPLMSRILSVADSYDAMTSDRAYRPAMTDAAARAEMLRVAGTQLDAELVEGFIETLDGEQGAPR